MNRALAEGLAAINAFVALLLIAGGALGGFVSGGPLGLFLGLFAGVVVAIILCGILAIFVQMHAELILIREALYRTPPK